MSLRRVEIPEPPPPPPPKRYEEALICDGCGKEGARARYGECYSLPAQWIGVRRVGEGGIGTLAPPGRIDLCPECATGAIVVLANERQLRLEDVR